jgi:hypothetical protein
VSRLEDIRVYGEQSLTLMASRDVEAFAADLTTQLAILHCLTLVERRRIRCRKRHGARFPTYRGRRSSVSAT